MSELNEQQLARLAKLGKRSGVSTTPPAAQPTVNPALAAPLGLASTQAPWSPPSGTPATATAASVVPPIIVIQPTDTTTVPVVDRQTSVRLFGSRRRHVAAAGRILATGLATSGFLATIASLATADARELEAKQADAAPPTTLVETIHRVVYVDEFGNPIAPPTTLSPLDTAAATTTTVPQSSIRSPWTRRQSRRSPPLLRRRPRTPLLPRQRQRRHQHP